MTDDDYCVSNTVIMLNARSCTRPPRRILDQQSISEWPISIPFRSPDQTRTSELTDISRQPRSLRCQFSNIGELCHVIIKCIS